MSLIDDLFGQIISSASHFYEEGYILLGAVVLLVVLTFLIFRSAGTGWALGALISGGGLILLAVVLLGGDD